MFEVWCSWSLFLGLFVSPWFVLQLWPSPVRIEGGHTFGSASGAKYYEKGKCSIWQALIVVVVW